MKKIVLLLTLITITNLFYGQTVSHDTTKREFKNIIGMDVTALLRQFSNSGSIINYYYNDPTIISYKRIIKSNAIRVGLGGYISNDNGMTNDTINTKNNQSSFNIRAGYEHYCYLSKRWMYYFGADLVAGHSTNQYITNWSANSGNKQISEDYSYGISPVLGITFQINSRLSIASEAAYDIIYRQTKGSRTATPDASYNSHSNDSRIMTQFLGPEFINLRLKF